MEKRNIQGGQLIQVVDRKESTYGILLGEGGGGTRPIRKSKTRSRLKTISGWLDMNEGMKIAD